jgi:ABC-type dipeptide/oligopeptide/nickel transport system permease component
LLTFILRRLISLPLVMLAVTVMIVGLMQFLSPQERAVSFVTNERQMQNLDRIIKERGLDQPFYVQYGSWISNALQGNLGFSKASNRPVIETIRERFPATLELALLACIPIIGLGIWLGTLTALNKDKLLDQVLRIFTVIGYCLPTFVVGILLLVVFYGALGILPGIGRNDSVLQITNPVPPVTGMILVDSVLAGNWSMFVDALQHMILPIITLATVSSAGMIKVMRAEMLDVLKSDYVRTARAKGLPDQIVNSKHARRNALLPIVTLASFTVQGLLSGAVITETIFGYPGIGSWGADAATSLDYPGVLGFAIFIAFITVLANLMADLLYGFVDPRVRFD